VRIRVGPGLGPRSSAAEQPLDARAAETPALGSAAHPPAGRTQAAGFGGPFAVARSGPGLVRRVVGRASGSGCTGAPGRGGSSCVRPLRLMPAKGRTRRPWRDPVPVRRPWFVMTTAPEGVRWLFSRPGWAERLSQPDTHSRGKRSNASGMSGRTPWGASGAWALRCEPTGLSRPGRPRTKRPAGRRSQRTDPWGRRWWLRDRGLPAPRTCGSPRRHSRP
jgi:hypothetical protein